VHRLLRVRAAGERAGHTPILTEWRKEIIEVSSEGGKQPVSVMTARRMSEALVKRGYVRLEPLNKKSKLVVLTQKGWKASEPGRGKWSRYIDIWVAPSPQERVATVEASSREEDVQLPERKQLPARRRRSVLSAEGQRIKHISSLRKNHQINGSYWLRFKGNKIRYIQLVTPRDEWVGGRLWLQLQVEFDQEGLPQYVTLLAEEDSTTDPVSPLVPRRWKARKDQVLTVAVEVEETTAGYKVAEYVDEHGELRLAIGVIVQSSANFFSRLPAQPHGKILRVRGTGQGEGRRYSLEPVADALPISTDFGFDQLVDDIASTHHRDRIARLPAGWFYMPPKRKALVQQLLGVAGST
jgi:hypothetical protein